MSKWKRRLLWIGAFVFAFVLYLWFFGAQTFCALWTRRIGRQTPIVKSVPVALRDLSVSKTPGKKLSFLEAEFEVPWDDVDAEKTRIAGDWVLIHFHSARSILLCVGRPKGFMNDLFKTTPVSAEFFTKVYGSEVLRSDYALKKAIFETTPSQIGLFTPPNRAAGLASVIFMKAIMLPTTDWTIFNVRSNEFKGFQLGDPSRRPRKMSVELYSDDGEFEFNFEQQCTGATPCITQPEINRIIQSTHRSAHAERILAVN